MQTQEFNLRVPNVLDCLRGRAGFVMHGYGYALYWTPSVKAQEVVYIFETGRANPVRMGDLNRMDDSSYFPSPMLKKRKKAGKPGRDIDRLPREGLKQTWMVQTVVKYLSGKQ